MRFIFILMLSFLFSNSYAQKSENLTKYVNPFIGTSGEGHTYPGATVPFGMVQPSPDTHLPDFNKSAFPWCAGYQYNDNSIIGFSQTHFSGTGHSDMGDILIMPVVGALNLDPGTKENPEEGYRSKILKSEEWAEPGYYSVMLKKYNIKAEMTATERTAFYKFTYPKTDTARIILDLTQSIYNYDGKVIWSEVRVKDSCTITGYRQTKGWAADRKVFFIIKFSHPIAGFGLLNDEEFIYKGFGKRDKLVINNTPDGICGNEDCGQMSAWYIFSSLGFYPVCPGSMEYVIGTPKLNKAIISVGDNKKFTITAINLSEKNFYIQSVILNGKEWNKAYIRHEDIMSGGELVFEMGPEPNKGWATGSELVPYSMTKKN
ncbi:MAG: glycoside hydrolase family 92 protein [Ignavibacteriae bacterium]|nr:glycoside hydrolase family 92 protein [Ignavibacteriota bacterium]